MAKAGRGADQYMLRLPSGLRDRIKAYSERMGTSINSEIVRILEIEFPEQWPVEDRLKELGWMLSMLTAGRKDPRFDDFSAKLEETVTGILSGRVTGVDPEIRAEVGSMWKEYQEREYHKTADQHAYQQGDRTDEELAAFEITGAYEKYAEQPTKPPDPFKDGMFLSRILPPLTLSQLAGKLRQGDLEAAADLVRNMPNKEIEERVRTEQRIDAASNKEPF